MSAFGRMLEWDGISYEGTGGTCDKLTTSSADEGVYNTAADRELGGQLPTLIRGGIEIALAQLLSDIFQLLRQSLALGEDDLSDVAGASHLAALSAYRGEISANLARLPKDRAGRNGLAEQLLGVAREFSVELPTLSAALSPREIAAHQRRAVLARTLARQPIGGLDLDPESILHELHGAFFAAMIITYAEALSLLAAVPRLSGTPFEVVEAVRLWKEDSATRATLLEEIASVLEATPRLRNLLCDDDISEKLMAHQEYLRRASWRAHQLGLLTPVLLAALDYMDLRRDAWCPVNLVQVSVQPEGSRQPAFVN